MGFCAFGALENGQTPGMGILPMRDFPTMGRMPMPRFSEKLPVLAEPSAAGSASVIFRCGNLLRGERGVVDSQVINRAVEGVFADGHLRSEFWLLLRHLLT